MSAAAPLALGVELGLARLEVDLTRDRELAMDPSLDPSTRCRVCGCTRATMCVEGCCWALGHGNLCSLCCENVRRVVFLVRDGLPFLEQAFRRGRGADGAALAREIAARVECTPQRAILLIGEALLRGELTAELRSALPGKRDKR